MKIKRIFSELLKFIIVFLLLEIPVVFMGVITFPFQSPDEAIKMQVPGNAISICERNGADSRGFLINGERCTGLNMLRIYPLSKAMDMIRQENKVDIQYFMIGKTKCIVDMRGESTVYADYTKEYAAKKIGSIVIMIIFQLFVGCFQFCSALEMYGTLKYGD